MGNLRGIYPFTVKWGTGFGGGATFPISDNGEPEGVYFLSLGVCGVWVFWNVCSRGFGFGTCVLGVSVGLVMLGWFWRVCVCWWGWLVCGGGCVVLGGVICGCVGGIDFLRSIIANPRYNRVGGKGGRLLKQS